MSTKLGELLIVLRAETSAFAKGLGDAKQLSFDTSSDIISSLRRVGDELGKLKFDSAGAFKKSAEIAGGVIAGIGVAVVASSVVIAKEVAEQAKQMEKLSQSYGLPIEQVSQLRVASKLTGVDMDTLTMGMGRLAKASATAAEGGKVQMQAFADLGVKVTDAQGHLLPMNQLLPAVAQGFSKLQDGTGKTALAMQLLGRSGAQLIPFLNQGAAGVKLMQELSDQLGLTWSKDDAEAAEIFAQRMEILDLKGTALKENFAKGLLPALDQIATAFVATDKNGNSVAKTLGETIGTAAKYLSVVIAGLVADWKQLLVVVDLRKWGKDAEDQFNKINEDYKKFANEVLNGKPISLIATGDGGSRTGTPTFSNLHGGKNPDAGLDGLLNQARQTYNKSQGDSLATQVSNIEHLKTLLQQFAAAHPDQIFLEINAAVEKLNVAEGELIAKYQGAVQAEIAKAAQEQIASVVQTPSSIPMASGQVQAESDFINLTKDLNEQKRLQAQIFEQTRTSMERYKNDVATLNLLYADKSSDEYNRALRDANERLTEAYDPSIKLQKAIEALKDAHDAGAISAANYAHQLAQLQAQQAMSATETNPQSGMAGVKQGVGAGAQQIQAEWKPLPAQIASATVQIGNSIEENMGKAITDMVMGTKTVGQAFAEMGRGILSSIVSTCAQMLAQWITTHIIMAAISRAFGAGSNPAGQQAAQTGAANVGMAQSYAGLAAAEAFALYMPEGLWTALAMAGVADGIGQTFVAQAGMAFAGATSAAGGMELPRDQWLYAHQGEKVLPARTSKGFDRIIDSFDSAAPGNGHRNVNGGAGGSSSVTYGGHTLHQEIYGATDAEEVANQTRRKTMALFRTAGVMKG